MVGLFAVGSLLLAGFASSFLVPLVLWIGSDGLVVNTGFTNVAKSKRFCFFTHFDTLDIPLVNVWCDSTILYGSRLLSLDC